MAVLGPIPAQLVDPQTGMLTDYARRWFDNLFNRVGSFTNLSAPINAAYITNTPSSDLTSEQALSLLSTGYMKVTTGSGAVTSTATIPAADVTSGDLTSTSDTNITLTLGGTPTGALLNATSITVGWAGTLAVARGGTGTGSAGITAFNNITGYTASGATGTTSTNIVFSTSPVFTTPQLGTVTSGDISACTSTSMVMVTPVLGTPTSGALTNCTGYVEANLVTTDVTTNNATTSKHGFLPKLSNVSTEYLDGTGAFSTPAGGGGSSYSFAYIRDEKSTTTAGQTLTATTWNVRDLNTETDPDGIVSISSNKFTLGSGTYIIQASCPAQLTYRTQARLYDVTNTTVIIYGSNGYSDASTGGNGTSFIYCILTVSGSTEYRIEQNAQSTGNGGFTNAFGGTEVYTQVLITQIA